MKSVHSVVVAFDGASKCGKTTFIEAVAREGHYVLDQQWREAIDALEDSRGPWSQESKDRMHGLVDALSFDRMVTISSGNGFRAATYYLMQEEGRGRKIKSFSEDDAPKLRQLLRTDGILDILQNDTEIGSRVSRVAKMAGVQALCGALFSDDVVQAYNRDNQANLVIVDARNPVDILRRNGVIGFDDGQIRPDSILPVYINTPTEVAAHRDAMKVRGPFCKSFNVISERRNADATRDELPVVVPTDIETDLGSWLREAGRVVDDVARPFWIENDAGLDMETLAYLCGVLSVAASDLALTIRREPSASDDEYFRHLIY